MEEAEQRFKLLVDSTTPNHPEPSAKEDDSGSGSDSDTEATPHPASTTTTETVNDTSASTITTTNTAATSSVSAPAPASGTSSATSAVAPSVNSNGNGAESAVQKKVREFLEAKGDKGQNFTDNLRTSKSFRNPYWLSKVISLFGINDVRNSPLL